MAFPAVTYMDPGSASAALVSNAAEAGLQLPAKLGPIAQLQSVVANLLVDDPATLTVPAADVSSGTFGANVPDTGIYSFPSQVGVGTTGTTSATLTVSGTATASAGFARGIQVTSTLVAAANSDVLHTLRMTPTFTPGAFTAVTARGMSVGAFSTAAFTSPADPQGIDIGIITGTGATNAAGIRIAPPTGATNNYLLSHSTPATFAIGSTGNYITSAGRVLLGTTPPATGAVAVDTASYANIALLTINGTSAFKINTSTTITSIGTNSAHDLFLRANDNDKWSILSEFATSTLKAGQVTARIVGGSTSGLAIRNSGNTRDNYAIADAGTSASLSNGTHTGGTRIAAATSGDLLLGLQFASTTTTTNLFLQPDVTAGTAGLIVGATIFNGTAFRSMWQAANVASGEGVLGLVKSGGNVAVGTTTVGATANKTVALTNGATAPTTSTDLAHLYCADISAGNAAFACFQESAVSAGIAVASTNKWPVIINGTTYYILMTTVP